MEQETPDLQDDRAATGRMEGLVVGLAPGLFEVAAGDSLYLCSLRGKLRKPRRRHTPATTARAGNMASSRKFATPATTVEDSAETPSAPTRVAPGDHVCFTPLPQGEGIIEEILPRRNQLARARTELGTEHVMMANLDQAMLVFAVKDPVPHLRLLDRYLALCEHAGIAPVICFNKIDLGLTPEVETASALYGGLGYTVLLTSAKTQTGIASLRAHLAGKISLLTGPSGVGKSSLMNDLLPDANQRIGEVSQATGKGRHTTTGIRLLPLENNGWLADSAGIRELALWQVPASELPQCFIELRPFADQCLYEDCTHGADEEGCALRAALRNGQIAPSRFESFERLLEDTRADEQPEWATRSH